MDRVTLFKINRTTLVDRITSHIENAAQHSFSNRHTDWRTGALQGHPSLQSLSRRHGDRPNHPFTKMLLDFEDQMMRTAIDREINLQSVKNFRHLLERAEIDVNYWADNLNNFTFIHRN